MELELQARHVELNDRVRDYVSRKVTRLDRYLPDIRATRVDLERSTTQSRGEVFTAQLTLWVDRAILRAEEVNSDLFAAIDLATDKLHRQIKRYQGKRQDRWQDRSKPVPVAPPVELEEDEDEGPRIVRRKRFEVLAMSEEEAAEQLELLGHDFFLFLNPDTGWVNVLYRRNDGNLGLLEPEPA